MRSTFRNICGLCLIGLAALACSKEIETEVTPEPQVVNKHSVMVVADYITKTKTEMLPAGNQTKWTDDDITNMHFFENGIAPEASDLTVSLNADKTELTIAAQFANTNVDKYVYTSILASNLDENKNAVLDDEQYILDGTFDPLADILVAKPEEFDAATAIAKHICQGNTVILNCEETNEQVARRVIDFLSGCAFALDGSIKKASKNVIIIAPREVGVEDANDGDQLGE